MTALADRLREVLIAEELGFCDEGHIAETFATHGLCVVTRERLQKLEDVERALGKPTHERFIQLCTRFEQAVLFAAKTFALHWRDQDGVNLSVLEQLYKRIEAWEASEPPENTG